VSCALAPLGKVFQPLNAPRNLPNRVLFSQSTHLGKRRHRLSQKALPQSSCTLTMTITLLVFLLLQPHSCHNPDLMITLQKLADVGSFSETDLLPHPDVSPLSSNDLLRSIQ